MQNSKSRSKASLISVFIALAFSACSAKNLEAQSASAAGSADPSNTTVATKVAGSEWRMAGYRESDVASKALEGYRPLRRVLVTLSQPALIAQLESAAPGVEFVGVAGVSPDAEISGSFDAVMLVCSRPAALDVAPDAIWIHSYSAGVEDCLAHPSLADQPERVKNIIMTNSSGTAASVIGEHAIAMMMSFSRGLHIFRDEQNKAEWSRSLLAESSITTTVGGKTMLVLGLGAIGKEVAMRAKALGMRVLATRNSSREGPEYVDYVGLSAETMELAAQADVVVNALPLTPSTAGMLNSRFFETMKPSALLISVGRGGTTNTSDLLAALKAGTIAGAALDVTDPEPLPSDHPLWQQRNVIITPHLAGTGGNARPKVFSLLVENVRRFQAGEPLLNPVSAKSGY